MPSFLNTLNTLAWVKDLVDAIREDVLVPKFCPPTANPRYDDKDDGDDDKDDGDDDKEDGDDDKDDGDDDNKKWVFVPSPDATEDSEWELVPPDPVEVEVELARI